MLFTTQSIDLGRQRCASIAITLFRIEKERGLNPGESGKRHGVSEKSSIVKVEFVRAVSSGTACSSHMEYNILLVEERLSAT